MDDGVLQPQKFKLVNTYEELTKLMVLRHITNDSKMCKCEKCYLDVCAIVLNDGFTKYVTTEQGELFASLDNISKEKEMSLMVSVLKAIELVKHSPLH